MVVIWSFASSVTRSCAATLGHSSLNIVCFWDFIWFSPMSILPFVYLLLLYLYVSSTLHSFVIIFILPSQFFHVHIPACFMSPSFKLSVLHCKTRHRRAAEYGCQWKLWGIITDLVNLTFPLNLRIPPLHFYVITVLSHWLIIRSSLEVKRMTWSRPLSLWDRQMSFQSQVQHRKLHWGTIHCSLNGNIHLPSE